MPATITNIITKIASPLAPLMDGSQPPPQPYRAQLLTGDLLIQFAKQVAASHRYELLNVRSKLLLERLEENHGVLKQAYFDLAEVATKHELLPQGADWLLDNFYGIEEQIEDIRKFFPKSYYKTLPRLIEGEFKNFPRIYPLVLEYISHTDAMLVEEQLDQFIRAYQEISYLAIGELWAVPIMLRLALVDNLSRLALNLLSDLQQRRHSESLAKELLADDTLSGTALLAKIIAEYDNSYKRLDIVGAHLTKRLGEVGPRAALALKWLEERMREEGTSSDEILRTEQRNQASNLISIGNTVSSLKRIGTVNWRKWFERNCLLESMLRSDPAQVYAASDFLTRNRYRSRIEDLARVTRRDEREVTLALLHLCREAESQNKDTHEQHVGYYLIDEGTKRFEKGLAYKPAIRERLRRTVKRAPLKFYLGLFFLLTAYFVVLLLEYAEIEGASFELTVLLAALVLLPASDLANNILQWLIAHFIVKPERLPRLDFSHGIPAPAASIVAVHTIFQDTKTINRVIEGLEVRYLANQDINLCYGLLADLPDAPEAKMPGDQAILDALVKGIDALNHKYCSSGPSKFFVFVRERKFNPSQSCFMGWERKRGKIVEFNRYLRGQEATSLMLLIGNKELLRAAQYVVTLDVDSQLPRGTAAELLGILAHPLNKPFIDPKRRTVRRGYAIVQPRVGLSAQSAHSTHFARIFSGYSGLDPYTQMVSDVYQDLFNEGSFVGKGAYHIDAFEEVVRNRIPDNYLLSHDLFEGFYARCGLASDIEFLDEFPRHYHAYARRQHRWVRGDWQLLPWLRPAVPLSEGKGWERSPLKGFDLWRLIDNLRRSLIAPNLMLLFCLGWCCLPGTPRFWTLFSLLVLAFPVYARVANALLIPPLGFSVHGYVKNVGRDLIKLSAQAALTLCFIPYQALLMLHAICVTLYRVLYSRKKLLEWETAFQSELKFQGRLKDVFHEMASAVLLGFLAFTIAVALEPSSWAVAASITFAWACAPFLAWYIGQPVKTSLEKISTEDRKALVYVAYNTWRYFEQHLVPEHNFLIPDNIQKHNQTWVLANRTSPTNLGMTLISIIGAYELGFLDLPTALTHLQRVLESMYKLERIKGHFLNWYQTDNSATLSPRYISSVDSGNLVACLLCVTNFLNAANQLPLLKNLELSSTNTQTESKRSAELISKCQDPKIAIQQSKQRLSELFPNSQALEKQTLNDLTAKGQNVSGILEIKNAASEVADKLIKQTDFLLLFDKDRNLFSIGYNLESGKLDNAYYDLLASESRLASFVSICLSQVPQRHWFALGRSLADAYGGKTLLSWAGTMFEYLMPCILIRDIPSSLLTSSYSSVIKTQYNYGRMMKVPWGVSESAYSVVDSHGTYQYRAFGVPGLGLKRGLSEDLVISPYSSLLALPFNPLLVVNNLYELEKVGALDEFGFFEAIDFTPERLGPNESSHVVTSYFAHHQGMSFASIVNYLTAGALQNYFHNDLRVKASELLLAERFPEQVPALVPHRAELLVDQERADREHPPYEVVTTPFTEEPHTHLISNGNLYSVCDNAGSGFLVFDKNICLNRWREDPVLNNYGSYIFVKDPERGLLWSTAYQPTRTIPEDYEAVFSPDKVEYKRKDHGIRLHTEVTISPTDNVEIRRVTITNVGHRIRNLELTSFMEVSLAPERADIAHPAFSKMFIQSEFLPDYDSLVFSRRKRSRKDNPLFMFHKLTLRVIWERTEFESSREKFIGRHRDVHSAIALENATKLECTTGAVLDPVAALRTRLEIAPGQSQVVTFITGVSRDRAELQQLIERYHDHTSIRRAFEQAQSQSSVEIRQQQYSLEQMRAFQRLGNALFFNVRTVRGASEFIEDNRLTQMNLWRFGISGDLPIVLMRLADSRQIRMFRELIAAHQFLRMRGVAFDLIILNDEAASYAQALHEQVEHIVRGSGAGTVLDQKGGIFIRKSFQLSEDEIRLLHAVARAVVSPDSGSLFAALSDIQEPREILPFAAPSKPETISKRATRKYPYKVEGELQNKVGAFSDWGKSYTIAVDSTRQTPNPWSNVIANPHFGFLVSESGSTYTWSENSRENRLTPWYNDPVSDRSGEVLYIVDPSSEDFWSATPQPLFDNSQFEVVHEFGATKFRTERSGISQELLMHGSTTERVKWWRLRLRNNTNKEKSLRLYFYVHPVLGSNFQDSYRFLNSSFDKPSQLLMVSNYYNNEFARRIVGVSSSEVITSFTCDRLEFVGSNGELSRPLALEIMKRLSGRTGAGFSQCMVLEVGISIKPGEWREQLFCLFEAFTFEEAKSKSLGFRSVLQAKAEYENVRGYWDSTTSAIQVKTPDRAFDIMLNGWLLYQTVSCRLWGRTGFYQSGGAIGFRDQLQDSMALLYTRPEITRSQIKLHASRQFPEGDVQHWWHPPTGRGVRTRISDDLLWLPYIVAEYVRVTGDKSILEERVSYLEGPQLEPHQDDLYYHPRQGAGESSVYEHCIRAIERSLKLGSHGLPLMGSGDWNDGMNEVGNEGKGESVWLGWFLIKVLKDFEPICAFKSDNDKVKFYSQHAETLRQALETNAWDGAWYLRAFFDNGTPLGSQQNPECSVDSLSQSWSVISEAADKARASTSLNNAIEKLVDNDAAIIKLLDPAFDKSELEPGYIKGYLPGIRENGGQYTHAAAWLIVACAMQGWGEKAFSLFQLINPARITSSEAGLTRYRGEPYVVCGDVYSNPEHKGRAGWSWYTGSASWLYRAGLEYILGLRVENGKFKVLPSIPATWKNYSMTYKYEGVVYEIRIENPSGVQHGVKELLVSGAVMADGWVKLDPTQRGRTIDVVVRMG